MLAISELRVTRAKGADCRSTFSPTASKITVSKKAPMKSTGSRSTIANAALMMRRKRSSTVPMRAVIKFTVNACKKAIPQDAQRRRRRTVASMRMMIARPIKEQTKSPGVSR